MLNHDPTDPDKMRLPVGVTCGDCARIARCKALFGRAATDATCDWSPSRFVAARPAHPTSAPALAAALTGILRCMPARQIEHARLLGNDNPICAALTALEAAGAPFTPTGA
jgi:hypothetical protein